MEVVNPCFAVLSNVEVMDIVSNIKDTKKKYGLRNLATISYEIIRFLDEGNCKLQTKANIIEFNDALKQFNLTKNECLMMINDPPTTPLHIQLIVEDSEERLTDKQVKQIIKLASYYLFPSGEE